MRFVALTLPMVFLTDGVAFAQSDSATRMPTASSTQQEPVDEVIVRGRRLTELRLEVDMAQERAYEIFNEINSNDEFDVYCREEGRTGTRSTRRVCRAQFERRISADAAREYMAALAWTCPADAMGAIDTASCFFGDHSQGAISRAQGVEGQAMSKRDQMNDEILRLARHNDRFARAILDYYEATQQYERARKRRDD